MAQTFNAAVMSAAEGDAGGNKLRAGGLKLAADLAELYKAAPGQVHVAGRYYHPIALQGALMATGSALPINTAAFLPLWNPFPVTVDQLFAMFTTAGTNYQVAFYNDNNGKPGTEICHSASAAASTTATAAALSTGSTAIIPAGLVWMGINVDNAATVAQTIGLSDYWAGSLVGSSTLSDLRTAGTASNFAYTTPLTFGTWGDLTAATWTLLTTAKTAVVGFRAA